MAIKSNPNYTSEEEFKNKPRVHQLKTVSFEDIHVPNKIPKIVSDNVAEKSKVIINWEVTPSDNPSKLLDQYLMLSKIRLTSKHCDLYGDIMELME